MTIYESFSAYVTVQKNNVGTLKGPPCNAAPDVLYLLGGASSHRSIRFRGSEGCPHIPARGDEPLQRGPVRRVHRRLPREGDPPDDPPPGVVQARGQPRWLRQVPALRASEGGGPSPEAFRAGGCRLLPPRQPRAVRRPEDEGRRDHLDGPDGPRLRVRDVQLDDRGAGRKRGRDRVSTGR